MTIRDLLRELGIEFREAGQDSHATRGWVSLQCCHCHSSSFKCGISTTSFVVNCWSCGRHKLGETLALASNRAVRDVLPLLAQLDRWDGETPTLTRETGTYKPPVGVGELLPVHRTYLQKRKLDPDELAQKYGVHGIGPIGTHRWSVFLPVMHKSKPVSWTCRKIGQSHLRYLSASPQDERVPLKHTLFNEDSVRSVCLVTEGPFDALRIGPGAVALYGAAFTEWQVCRIACYPVRILCLDSDDAGRAASERLVDLLSVWPGDTIRVELESGKDASEVSDSELNDLRHLLK